VRRDRINAWAWRLPLIAAVLAMVGAAVLAASGQRAVSDVLVTIGFAIGILSVPVWLFTGSREHT
jgi:uncharacterized membrane protein